jgi:hypothetical protein
MPDTRAYDREFELQKAAMDQQISGQSQLMQMQLNSAFQRKQDLLGQIRDMKLAQADASRDALMKSQTKAQEGQLVVLKEELAMEKARQMSVLVGAPPPEKSASAPVISPERKNTETARKGKTSLRIDRPTATSSARGVGLSIT